MRIWCTCLDHSIYCFQVLNKTPLLWLASISDLFNRKNCSNRRAFTWNNHSCFEKEFKHWFDAFNCFLFTWILILAWSIERFRCNHDWFNILMRPTSYLCCVHKHMGTWFNSGILVMSCTKRESVSKTHWSGDFNLNLIKPVNLCSVSGMSSTVLAAFTTAEHL